jgi:hypothetical protein
MKNDYTLSGDGKTITVWLKRRNGQPIACLVDASDLPKLRAFDVRWYAAWSEDMQSFYVSCSVRADGNNKTVLMHRFLMDFPQGLLVDHWNHVTTDNRRENLRAVTPHANSMNRRGATILNKTGHRGICRPSGSDKFLLTLTINGKRKHIGRFSTIEDALIARKQFPEYERT